MGRLEGGLKRCRFTGIGVGRMKQPGFMRRARLFCLCWDGQISLDHLRWRHFSEGRGICWCWLAVSDSADLCTGCGFSWQIVIQENGARIRLTWCVQGNSGVVALAA